MATKTKSNGAASALIDLQVRYSLSRVTLAEWLGVAEAALANGETKTPEPAILTKTRKIEQILKGLARVMKEDYIQTWLTSPNSACDGRAPTDCLKDGDYQTVEDLVYFLQAGEPV